MQFKRFHSNLFFFLKYSARTERENHTRHTRRSWDENQRYWELFDQYAGTAEAFRWQFSGVLHWLICHRFGRFLFRIFSNKMVKTYNLLLATTDLSNIVSVRVWCPFIIKKKQTKKGCSNQNSLYPCIKNHIFETFGCMVFPTETQPKRWKIENAASGETKNAWTSYGQGNL